MALRAFTLVAAFLVLLSGPRGAAAQDLPRPPSDAPEIRVEDRSVQAVLTISGGISLGSYQAGVNWGLVEVFKRTREAGFRARHGLPRYELSAMGGASAGNINAFLTAIEWCHEIPVNPVPADSSLFWNVWVRTGWEQLFPPVAYAERTSSARGILSREYFEQRHFPEVERWMEGRAQSDAMVAGCSVPVGVTVTRLEPGEVAIAPALSARTQRYASVLEVREVEGRLRFSPPSPELRSTRILGELVHLPPASRDDRRAPSPSDSIQSRRVFFLILASSAFPAAFSPVELEFMDPSVPGCRTRNLSHCLRRTYFSDGGLFDNNPIDLAVGIHNLERLGIGPPPSEEAAPAFDRSRQEEQRRLGADTSAILVYINPGQLRGVLREREVAGGGRTRSEGIGGLVDLFGGAIPAARQYELHSFDRQLARAPELFDRNRITVTTRSFPIVGEHLGAFAAFLGRPFREYDFFVGAYDALHFFARESCTWRERLRVEALRSEGRQPELSESPVDFSCLQERLRALLTDEDISLGPVGGDLARRLYRWEMELGGEHESFRVPEGATEREVLVLSLLPANARLLRPFDETRCSGLEWIRELLCARGFARMLHDYATPEVRRVARVEAAREVCRAGRWLDAPAVPCLADGSLLALLNAPDRFTSDVLGGVVRQMDRVERMLREEEGGAWSRFSRYAEILHHSVVTPRHARGFAADPSSIPPGARGPALVARLLPAYVSFNFGSSGFEAGYRPTYHWSSSFATTATLAPLHSIKEAESELDRYRWVAGLNLMHKGGPFLSGVEVGGAAIGRWRRSPFGEEADLVWAVPVTAYLLAGKVRLGARVIPGNDSRVHDRAKVAFTFGVADANGIVYWLARGMAKN